MAKLTDRKKIAVFISGRGSNLKSLINYSKTKKSLIEIVLVISNNELAKGLNLASKYKINNLTISPKNNKKFEFSALRILKKNKVDILCLAGFMRILSPTFIKKFSKPILNIHPSLLPKYKGLNTHKKVIENKEKYSGCTVHYVNSHLDAGKIILQKKVKILKNDDELSLKKKILKEEHILYPKALGVIA